MKHQFSVSGMTCSSCEANVKAALLTVDNVRSVEVSVVHNSATVVMDKHVALPDLQDAIASRYKIFPTQQTEILEETKSWFETYKPILLIFGFISLVTLVVQSSNAYFDWMAWMRHFMAGFFLVFSFFKFLNLKGFAQSYAMYDVVAKKIPSWAYIYAFVELGLGIAYLINFNPWITNLVTAVVMTLSLIGVLQTVLQKRKIQCACLGAVFNLPMSTVTIIEDGLMIAMSLVMLLML